MTNSYNGIFLDRDGVINEKRDDYVKSTSELKIFPYVAQSIKKFHELGFIVIVITNQSGVARGIYTENDVKKLHKEVNKELKKIVN